MKPEWKKLLLLNLPYLLFVYLFAKCGQAYRLAAGADASAKLLHLTGGISAAFANPLPSLHPFDLCVGVAGAVAVRLIVYSKGKNAKKYRKGEEYGSARWGTAKDIAPYIDPKFENNILLTQTERLTMTGRPKDPKTARNKNVLVIGGSGSGKTRFYVKPNLMQCFPTSDYPTSFVVTDPKGTLVLETGQMFQRAGYRVKILNTINFSKSMKYNPFVYIHSEKDVLKLVNTLIANTKGEGEKSAEDFWVKSERLFYTALIGYIWYEAPAEEMNFTTLLEMINASEAREDDPEFQSPVDLMFERLEQKDPDHFAVRQYKKFLLSAGKTRSSILISCGARLAPFDIREVRELMEDDEMELDTIGDEKTVLFLIMSDTDTTFNFILAMLQSQLINLLCDRADDKYGGRLPVHVRLILDEFANIGQIPNFDKLIATIRSREISASIILQSQSQLKAIYKDAAEIISDNCDSVLFLSGRGKNAKEISDALGKETIDSFNTSENRGSQTSHGLNYQKLGKQLKKLGMLIIQDQIWGRVTQNRSQGRATWYFADEFHLLLKEEQTAAYSAEIWKRFRKWGGVPTGATQNVKDLLSSPEIENILENSDFITLLNQASGDRKILSERLNLSADQQKYIDNSEPGEGLLIFENVVLPFSNPIPKNTQLYKIMTTRLSEVVEL